MCDEKWDSIEWIGTLQFPAEYEPKRYQVPGFGPFEADLEERLYHFAGKLGTDYVKNPIFMKNFKASIAGLIPAGYEKMQFPSDYMPYLSAIKRQIEEAKAVAKVDAAADRKRRKARNDELKAANGTILFNGEAQALASFAIEPPGILMTRGDDKRLGCWKYRVRPEDVTVNASKGKGPKPPAGHKWAAVVENKNAIWMAHYFVKIHGFEEDLPKKVLLHAASVVTKDREQEKYEKARQLILKWDEIQQLIMRSFKSDNRKTRLTAAVTYLVQITGCRIGGEKDLDVVADTVGIATLRKEHVSLSGNSLTLDFLGKDSVRYVNTIEVCPDAAKIISERLTAIGDKDRVFQGVTSVDASDFLRQVVPDASIKTFRTAYGTKLLCEELQKNDLSDKSLTVSQKLQVYDRCNLAVAKKLNHKKTPPKNFDETTESLEDALRMSEEALKDFQRKLSGDMKKLLEQIKIAKETFTGEHLAKCLEKYDEKKKRLAEKLEEAKERVAQRKAKLEFRKETKEVAINTSRSSYSSPRIAYSWCKDVGVPIDKIYSKAAIGKMSWAEGTAKDYWKKFPNVRKD